MFQSWNLCNPSLAINFLQLCEWAWKSRKISTISSHYVQLLFNQIYPRCCAELKSHWLVYCNNISPKLLIRWTHHTILLCPEASRTKTQIAVNVIVHTIFIQKLNNLHFCKILQPAFYCKMNIKLNIKNVLWIAQSDEVQPLVKFHPKSWIARMQMHVCSL